MLKVIEGKQASGDAVKKGIVTLSPALVKATATQKLFQKKTLATSVGSASAPPALVPVNIIACRLNTKHALGQCSQLPTKL